MRTHAVALTLTVWTGLVATVGTGGFGCQSDAAPSPARTTASGADVTQAPATRYELVVLGMT